MPADLKSVRLVVNEGTNHTELKRLKEPFAGAGMLKLGDYNTKANQIVKKSKKAKQKTKELTSTLVEDALNAVFEKLIMSQLLG